MWEDVGRFYANSMPFYIRDLRIHGFWYLGSEGGVLEPTPLGYRGTTVFRISSKVVYIDVAKELI